ncbi:MAG: GMC oxidoreductase [Myxococcota bacterium]
MSARIVVIGAGPSGLHFARTLLERGIAVTLVDAGRQRGAAPRPELTLDGLKRELPDATEFFLGREWQAFVRPDREDEYYGLPPAKDYVFESAPGQATRSEGFEPLSSFAAGGLAEAWTGGSYPFTASETRAWPFEWAELHAAYGRVARRIGISGASDDELRDVFPAHDGLLEPLPLDSHGAALLASYQAARERIRARDHVRLGYARIATLSRALGDRPACHSCGRCLWGCPSDALYTPSVTLRECARDARFEYRSGWLATHLRLDAGGRATGVALRSLDGAREETLDASAVVLAAGALGTSRVVLESLARSGERAELPGLMDNRQVLMPFVNLHLVGKRFESASYQYHQLALAYEPGAPRDAAHGLFTTLKTALVHPIAHALPGSLARGLGVLRNIHAALGLLNVNFADERRDDCRVALEPAGARGGSRLVLRYSPDRGEPARVGAALRALRRMLLRLGCVAPPPMTRWRPMGASVHYAGTLPMSRDGGALSCDASGRLRGLRGVWIADGASFPTLPAKNLTFTLMANATRIAERFEPSA